MNENKNNKYLVWFLGVVCVFLLVIAVHPFKTTTQNDYEAQRSEYAIHCSHMCEREIRDSRVAIGYMTPQMETNIRLKWALEANSYVPKQNKAKREHHW